MNKHGRTDYETRDSIMKLLSDQEVSSVSTAETAVHLIQGEQYIDLERIEDGVRTANGAPIPMGRVLTRRAVHEATWNNILTQLRASATPATKTLVGI